MLVLRWSRKKLTAGIVGHAINVAQRHGDVSL